jgi:hypothetical protein
LLATRICTRLPNTACRHSCAVGLVAVACHCAWQIHARTHTCLAWRGSSDWASRERAALPATTRLSAE